MNEFLFKISFFFFNSSFLDNLESYLTNLELNFRLYCKTHYYWNYTMPYHFVFSIKTFFFLLMVFGIRGIIPRYRYDQVSRLNWKQLLLITTSSLIITGNLLILLV